MTDRWLSMATSPLILENGSSKRIRVRRAHMEEDTGKLSHVMGGSLGRLQSRRSPLLEIVSEPDLISSDEAARYARKLTLDSALSECQQRRHVQGHLRFEANVSVLHASDTSCANAPRSRT